jgi:hypothetical protein
MCKKLLICFWAVVLMGAVAFESTAQTIGAPVVTTTAGSTSATGYCAAGQIRVTFTAAMFAAGTNFNVLLTGPMGGAATTIIGSGTASPITATLPAASTDGTGYQVRVVSVTMPAVTSAASSVFQVTNTLAPTVASATQSYCQNAMAAPFTASGSGIRWYNAATGGSFLGGPIYAPNTTAIGTTTVYASQTVSGCESQARTSVAITVNLGPTVNAVANAAYCRNAAGAAINFSSATAGTNYNWTSSANVGFGTMGAGNIAAFTATNAGNTPITANVSVTPTAGGCVGSPTNFTVTVNPTPTVNAVPNATFCGNVSGAAINFSGAVGGTSYNWTSSANAGFGTMGAGNIGAYTTANNPAAAIVANVSVTPTANGCVGTAQGFSVTVNPSPVINPVGSVAVCNSAMASAINFSSATPGTNYNWTSSANAGFGTSGIGNIAAFTAANATANPTVASVNVTPSTATCTGAAVGFTVTVNPTPAVTALSNLTYCGNTAVAAINFSSTTPNTTFGWTSTANAGFGTTGSGNIGGYTTINTPTAQTVATVSVNPTANTCVGAPRSFTITINPTPTVNGIGNATFCHTAAGGAIAFGSATPATTFAWTSSANVGFGTNGTGNIAAYTASNAGATAVTSNVSVTPTAGTCVGPAQNFVVTVSPTPRVNALGNLTYCGSAAAPAINFGSTTPSTSFGWTSSADVGFGATGNGNINAFTTANPVTTTASSTITVTPTANTCPGPAQTFTITINPTPTVNTIENATFCGNTGGGAISFSSNTPNSTFAWSTPSNAGFGTSGSGNIGAYTTVNPNDVLNANVSVAASTSSCPGPSRTFTIRINPTPGAPGVRSPDVYCQFVPSSPLSATPNGSNGLNWFDTNSSGVNGAPTPGTGTPGDFTYSVSQTSQFNCVSPRSNIIVTIKPQPAVPGIPRNNFTLCQFDPAVQLTANGSELRWYQPNNTVVNTVPTITTQQGFMGSYGVTQTVNGCESQRGTITVEIRTTPLPGVPANAVVYCQNATPRPLETEATGMNLKFYRNETGGEGAPSIGIFTQTPGTYNFYVTQTGSNSCESPRAKIVVAIQPLPTATISGDASITQGQSANLKLEFSGQGPWNYVLSNGFMGTAAANQNPATIVVSPLETTVYTLNKISNNCGEGTPAGTATINVRTATINTGNPSVTTLCASTTFDIPYFSSDFVPSNAQYRVQISKNMDDDASFQTIPTEGTGSPLKATVPAATPGGEYFVRVIAVTNFTVKGKLSPVKITVRELPTAAISGPASIFENESAKLSIALTGESPWKIVYKDSLAQMNTSLDLASSPYEFTVMPGKTNVYNVVSITNVCGAGPATSRFVLRANPVLSVAPAATGGEWLKVYPMPVQATCIIEIEGAPNKPVSVVVMDINGRVVNKKSYSAKENEMDMSNLAPGVYFLNAEQNGRIARRKILKIQ